MSDLISRSEAKKLGATCLAKRNENGQLEAIISLDNAPKVNEDTLAEDVINTHENIGYEKGFRDGYAQCVTDNERQQGEWIRKEDVIHSIAKQYSEHNELVPIWLSIGDMKGGAE